MDVISFQGPAQRVAFTADFFRCSVAGGRYRSTQARNAAWLREVVTGGQAWQRRGLEVQTVFPAEDSAADGPGTLGPAALAEYTADAESAWSRRYDGADLADFGGCLEALGRTDLVVGFELSPGIKRHLNRQRRPYISFHVHALRMLRDLALGACTNCPDIARELERFVLPASEITRQVHHHRALCLMRRLPLLNFPAGLPLLIGQTERDSVLIADGRFDTWQNHREAVHEHLRGHDAVILLPHPYRPDSMEIAEELRLQHGKTVLSTTVNGYALLLSNEQIPFVMTLASSLAVEAQAMGVPAVFLLGDPRQRIRVDGLDHGPQGPLGHGVLSDAFWSRFIAPLKPARRPAPRRVNTGPFDLGEGYLRGCLDSWAFGLLERGLQGATNRTLCLPAPGVLPARLQQILDGLGNDPAAEVHAPRIQPAWRASGIDLVDMDPPLDVGESRSIDLSRADATLYLAKGFHPVESWGVWTNAPCARLRVPLMAQPVGARLQVGLEMRPFDGLLANCPVVRVSCAGATLAFAFFRPADPGARWLQFEVPTSGSACLIDLEISDISAPSYGGRSADSRLLGLALTRLDLRYGAANDPATPGLAPTDGLPVLSGVADEAGRIQALPTHAALGTWAAKTENP